MNAIVQTRAAIVNEDTEAITRNVYAIKRAFAMVQEHAIVAIRAEIETKGRAGHVDAMSGLLARLSDARPGCSTHASMGSDSKTTLSTPTGAVRQHERVNRN